MRITLVSETFWPQTNGVSRVLGRLVEYARAQGHQVQLIIPRYPERESHSDEIHVPSFGFPLYPEVRVCIPRRGKIWNQILSFQPDLIHIATEGTLGLAILLKARKGSIPVVSSFHTYFPQYLRHYHAGFLENTCWRYLGWFHNQNLCTFCPSYVTQGDLRKRGFKNVEIWSRGLDTSLFTPQRRSAALRQELGIQNNEVLALYVGRLAGEKNLPLLLDTFTKLHPSLPEVKLVLVGDGPYRSRVENLASSNVLCVGYKRGEELATHYASADLFAFPSVTETFGNVVLEAMGSGLPVVGFNAGGVPHSVRHGENGLLAEPKDRETFLENLKTLCQDRQLREKMGHAARSYAESQTWELIFSRLFENYQTIINSKS